MTSSTSPWLLSMAPWTEFDTITIGGLVALLLLMLRKNWKEPIPLGALIGLVAGSLLDIGLEIASGYGHLLPSSKTRELLIVGTILGALMGSMFKLTGPVYSEAPQAPPDGNQPPKS